LRGAGAGLGLAAGQAGGDRGVGLACGERSIADVVHAGCEEQVPDGLCVDQPGADELAECHGGAEQAMVPLPGLGAANGRDFADQSGHESSRLPYPDHRRQALGRGLSTAGGRPGGGVGVEEEPGQPVR
jgi:hypothetical protein